MIVVIVIVIVIDYIISTMPRVSQRQKNKPFKSKSKGVTDRKQSKASTKKTKSIAKTKGRVKNSRSKLLNQAKEKKVAELSKIQAKNQHLDEATKSVVIDQLRNQAEVKIVVLLPANREANTNVLVQDIYKGLENATGLTLKTEFKGIPYPVLQIVPTGKTFIKSKLMIISGMRNNKIGTASTNQDLQSLMDIIKCSDIICPVLSCKSTDVQGMGLDPHEKGGAFDEVGYTLLNLIRSMGTPTTIGIVQDLQVHQMRHHDKIERLFKRFISSQLGQSDRINYLKGNHQQMNKLIRQLDTTTVSEQAWKAQRGYMLVEDITSDEKTGNLTFHGFLKGNSVYANQLVHVTGFDDYEIEKIEIKPRRNTNARDTMAEQGGNNLVQYSTNPQSLFPFSKKEQISDDILSGLNKLQVTENKPQNNNNNNEQQMEEKEEDFEDQSDDEEDMGEGMEEFRAEDKETEKTKRIQMQMRKEDQLEFEDQVQYAADEILRDKLKDYQGLKNFKTSEWNELQNLPDEYDRIYTFKHYTRTHNAVLSENESKSFAYPNFYISVTVKGFPKQQLLQHSTTYPTILTFLLKHERKMTQLHLKVRRNPYYPSNSTVIESNQQYAISLGFRRVVVRPIFSRVIQGTQKTKYTKKIEQDYESYFYCSFYYYNTFPPAPAQIYRVNQMNLQDKQASPIMYGSLACCNPLHIILQRIILTGYPYKIHKRRSTVRFMFFNPKDVKYFKPVQVKSKMGLKGRIQESLGTHGYMKVLFNDKIKHNDTVCMYLYRRVFPETNF